MPTPKFLALVSDLDDTLLTERHEMTDRTVSTLRRLMRQNVRVILASGRSSASVRKFVKLVGTKDPYIGYNGAQIVDGATHQVLSACEIPVDLSRETLRWFEARNVYVQFYDGDDWFFEKQCALSDDYGHSTGILGTEVGEKLSGHIHAPTPKLLAIADPADVPALIEASSAAFGGALSITTSKPYFIEITSPEATKGNAVKKLAEMIGLSPETTLCAGDSLNDMSMLSWTKWPVTVDNARDEVKRIAWRVAGNAYQDGMAGLLDELIQEE